MRTKMRIKEKIKKDIDAMPEELLYQLQKYLDSIKSSPPKKVKIKNLHLKGQYDNVNIRQKAYE